MKGYGYTLVVMPERKPVVKAKPTKTLFETNPARLHELLDAILASGFPLAIDAICGDLTVIGRFCKKCAHEPN